MTATQRFEGVRDDAREVARRGLLPLAVTTVALHALGLAFAVLTLRPGTGLVPLVGRVAYVARAPLGWSLGWGVWMLCAGSLVAFLAVVARVLDDGPGARLAVLLALGGASVDLLCDCIYLCVEPLLAAQGPTSVPTLLAFDRLAVAGGAIVGNGLYSIAVLLLSVCLARRGAARTVGLGYAVFVAGMAMVAAGLDGVPQHLELATGPTMGLYCVWVLAVAWRLTRPPVDDAGR